MSSQTLTSSDRSRTYWTPTMERYFIDLMLDHMHRGNRVGHTFNKLAWMEMLSVFNARFGSQYDKDVLKSRYTNLWKQFNDIKQCLGQIGFSWDETRQMVVADDCAWEAYLTAHPDARPFKTKAVLNFDDLCLIYGYTTADGRYSRSSHDVDIEDEIPGVMGEGMTSLTLPCNERSRTDWTPVMDQYFIELMLDQLGRGNYIDNTFNKHAWTDMLTLFNAKFGPQHGKRVLRHRYKKLCKYYGDVKTLLEQDGFCWDETQQMIIAGDDIWDAYIKEHPPVRFYKTKTLPNFKDLSLIYGDAANNGTGIHLRKCNKDMDGDILGTNDGEGKESQPSTTFERSRTYWTPPMDRYLIDLLLDQVYKGNKLGQTFISKAWIDMSSSFNVRFNCHHDKDVLKNRYKHLRRQYNDITFLLDQTGFSWDETREMVVAEDITWDAYTKEHPDARSYRVKTVPSYHKLCVIYGPGNYDGRYNRLAYNVDSAGEVPVLMTDIGEQRCNESPVSIGASNAEWTPEMDSYFIDLMLEQVPRGNKPDDIFNDQAWIQIFLSFNERFGHRYEKNILENRYICLMKEYSDISDLLCQNGFTWDESQQIITASNDVWEAYMEEHPDAILYKNKTFENFNNLCLIFANESSFVGFHSNSLDTEMDHNVLQMNQIDEISLALQSPAIDIKMSDQSKKRQSNTPPSASPRKVKQKSNESTLPTKNAGKRYIIMEKAIDALQGIPDIDDDLLLDACDLMEDERKAKTFLALDSSLRKKWLLRKLRP